MFKPLISLVVGITVSLACGVSHATYWEIHPLGTLGGNFSVALDLNNAGQVVGNAQTEPRIIDPADPPVPFVLGFISAPNGGALTELGTLGGFSSHATAVNNRGEVVGTSTIGRSFPSSFITDANGTGIRPFRFFSEPADINNVGQVVSNDFTPVMATTHAFISNTDGGGEIEIVIDPDTLDEIATMAVAVNDFGQVAVNNSNFGYLWSADQGARNLTPGALSGAVIDINNAGRVLGTIVTDSMTRAFLTAPDGGPLTLIGTPGDGNMPSGLNDLGQVVGTASFAGAIHAYVTGRDGTGPLIDLETLPEVVAAGWSGLTVAAINDLGQIAGTGIVNGQQRAFLLTPIHAVPEPDPYALMLAGLGLLGIFARQRVG